MNSRSILSELEAAISTRSGQTSAILRQVTDLFLVNVGNYSKDQLGVYDDVLSRLVETIEVTARAELSHRLAAISGAPLNTIRSLALDNDINVAEPVLSQSHDLDDVFLAQCAATKSQEHLIAIAGRQTLSEIVTNQLVKRGETPVLGTLAKNSGAKLSDEGFKLLVKKSAGIDWLSEAVGLRQDIPEVHFRKLISKASKAVIQKLQAADPKHANLIEGFLGAADDQDVGRKSARRSKPKTANFAADKLAKQEELTEDAVRELADAKKIDDVIDSIAQLSGLTIREVESLIMNTWSGPIACLLKSIGFRLPTLNAIYCMRLSDGETPGEDLHEAKLEFHRISRSTAERIIRFYKVRQLDKRNAG